MIARTRRRDRDAAARALTARILEAEHAALPPCATRAEITETIRTSTGMAVVMVANAGARCLVVKLPLTAAAKSGQERESRVLAGLHADDRLGEWRRRLPRPLARGVLEARPYRIDAALPGRPVPEGARDPAALLSAQETAAGVIGVLHRATAHTVVVDDATATRWIDARATSLLRRRTHRGALGGRFDRLLRELRSAVVGRTLPLAWIHGDFWLGNLLAESDLREPWGIVDWETAAADELPLHDAYHLLFTTRRLEGREELGTLIARRLAGADWSPSERRVLESLSVTGRDEALDDRHALLLYWLRHAAVHAEQQPLNPGPRYRVWERRNVHRVLAAC
jgi:aminoglycoside phosphotransferase (APT) family kinase protein